MGSAARRYVSPARAEAAAQTRHRILSAAREALFTLPFDELTLPLVAARAGVTTQTVRNHVESKDGLLRAVADLVSRELLERRRAAAPADDTSVVRMLAAEYDDYGAAINRLRAAAERSPSLAAMARRGRREHSRWLEATFADRLPTDRAARRQALAGLYAATDVGTWWLLRHELGSSRSSTVKIMRTLIQGALAAR